MHDLFLNYGVEAFCIAMVSVVFAVYKILAAKLHQQSSDQKAIKNVSLALSRSEIIRNYDHYCSKAWIPLYAVENVLELYEAYTALGGNGAVTKLVDELKALPSQDHCK